MIARAGILVVALAACGGGTRSGGGEATAPAGPSDPATMRALLARYSPSGNAIVTTYEALPHEFTLVDGGPWTITHDQGYDDFFPDGAIENVVRYTSTGVHEITHGYTSLMGFQLLVERGLPYGEGAEAILADGDPWLVPFTATYPAAEMDATFPADARTFRYGVYVTSDEATQSTQSQGVYGLLDELAAYYQDARTVVDFWPWVRDEAPASEAVAREYLVALLEVREPYAELQLYILHYLLHASDDVRAALLANDGFRDALVAVIDAYTALLATVDALEPTVRAFADRFGVVLGGSDDDVAFRAVLGYLQSEPYQAILATLRE